MFRSVCTDIFASTTHTYSVYLSCTPVFLATSATDHNYLREEQTAISRAVKDGFDTLEPVWQRILAKHREEIETARNRNMAMESK